MVLGRVSRPIHLNGLKRCSERESSVGFGSIGANAKGKGAFYGDVAPVFLPRARSEQSISKVRGASGDEDPLVRFSRETLSLVTSQTTERRRLTDEALCEEASR